MRTWAWLLIAIVCAPLLAADDRAISAVEKAMPWLESESQWWIAEKKCVSCHHTTFSIWARQLALSNGIAVDAERLERDREWTVAQFLSERVADPDNPKDIVKPGELNGERNVEGMAQLLLSPVGKSVAEKERQSLRAIAIKKRAPNGSWKPNGQLPLQKRPKEETAAVSRLWISHAFGLSDDSPNYKNAITTEWYALRAITDQSAESLSALVTKQNQDGGWSWQPGEPSCPSATGQALLAIARCNKVKQHLAEVDRAKQWIYTNQTDNGSWKTYSTKRRTRSNRISNFWGTTWAVIGLLESSQKNNN